MPEFHETRYGQAFFLSQLPALIEALEVLGTEIKNFNSTAQRQSDATSQLTKEIKAIKEETVKIQKNGKNIITDIMNEHRIAVKEKCISLAPERCNCADHIGTMRDWVCPVHGQQ